MATSMETVSDYKNYCGEVCYGVVSDESMAQMGGQAKFLRLMKVNLAKEKNRKGCNIEGQWVFDLS